MLYKKTYLAKNDINTNSNNIYIPFALFVVLWRSCNVMMYVFLKLLKSCLAQSIWILKEIEMAIELANYPRIPNWDWHSLLLKQNRFKNCFTVHGSGIMTRREQDKTIVVGVGERVTLDCTMAPYINSTGPEQFWEIQWSATLNDDASLKNVVYLQGDIICILFHNIKDFLRLLIQTPL